MGLGMRELREKYDGKTSLVDAFDIVLFMRMIMCEALSNKAFPKETVDAIEGFVFSMLESIVDGPEKFKTIAEEGRKMDDQARRLIDGLDKDELKALFKALKNLQDD